MTPQLQQRLNDYPKVAQLKTVAAFRARLVELGLSLPVDERILTAAAGSPLAASIELGGFRVGNRWCIHPMEGWDANRDGTPSEHTLRRWRNFGQSGAKLIWGGEAAAVQPDGRANANQTLATESNREGLRHLLAVLREEHRKSFDRDDDLLVGLQLTHSGRFCRPNGGDKPRIAYHHPLLDEKFDIRADDDSVVCSDDEIERLIDSFVAAARLAHQVGFQFVDVKACHGYLVHEFLSARRRPGKFGGGFEGRTRLLLSIIGRIRSEVPRMMVGVRLSIFDTPPYKTSCDVGEPVDYQHLLPYEFGFGVNPRDPLRYDLSEPIELLRRLKGAGVVAVNISAGSPYYNPHVQRPAIFPPSDGYQPPEDPLAGVARQLEVARQCKEAVPGLPMVGSGYSYLQEYVAHVAQGAVRSGWIDIVGLGRMVLAYPEFVRDVLEKGELARKRLCRTFSDCTTGPRNGMISGCFPLDPYYKALPEAEQIKAVKQQMKNGEPER